MRYGVLATSLRALVPVALFLTALTASADGPAPPAGATPSASQLQQAHDLGQNMASSHFDAEVFPLGGPPPKDLLRPKFDEFMKGEGSRLSEAEKEVFTEAYWSKYDKKKDKFGMTEIGPPNLTGASPTTVVSGKTATPGPGTLQLTDKRGNSYFVDVDANGNYSTTVPQGNFQPTKMTLRTGTVKAAWELKDGKWTQIGAATTTPNTQGAMAPPRGGAVQQVAYVDECKEYAVIGSLDHDAADRLARRFPLPISPLLLPVRYVGDVHLCLDRRERSFAHLVGEGPPPTPTQSGHRLADLERYKAQGKDAYGNDLPQDPAQREQKVNEREAKIQTEKGKLEGSSPQPTWPQNGQEQMRQAYLERQRYYLEQDLKAAEDKAKQAGKTGADLRRDPDVKKARQALLDNENEFLRNKLPLRSAPLALLLDKDKECEQYALVGSLDGDSSRTLVQAGRSSFLVPVRLPGGTGSLAVRPNQSFARLVVAGQSYTVAGTASRKSRKPIPQNTVFVTGAMLAPHETSERFVSDWEPSLRASLLGGTILRDRLWIWGAYTANQDSPPLSTVDANGRYEYPYKVGLNYGVDKDWSVGLGYDYEQDFGGEPDNWRYKVAISHGFDYGCGKISAKDLVSGNPVPPVAIEDRNQVIKGLMPGANLWQIDDTFKKNGLGSVEGWDLYHSPFNPSEFAAYKIAESDLPKFNEVASWHFSTFGPNYGINTAPAPAWRPENWPSEHPRGIPTARVNRKEGRP